MSDPKLNIDVEINTRSAEDKTEKALLNAGKTGAASFAAGFKANAGLIAASVVGVAALAKTMGFLRDSIAAAATQQQAVNDLNTQLAITGQFSEQASRSLQEFAKELQNTSRFGDEAILGQLAFAQAMGATAEQSKLAVSAGADLAESLNIDLNSAVRNVSKTLGGYAGELGEVIPELKALTQEQLRAGAGIDLIAEKFGGAAQGRVRTFTGAVDQLRNVFGDFQEVIGNVVVNSPAFISVINTTTQLISKFTQRLSGISDNDPFGDLLLGTISLARTVNEFLIPPFRQFFGFVNTGVNIVKTTIQGLVAAVAAGVNGIVEIGAKIPGALGAPFREIAESARQAKETTDEILGELVDETLSELVTSDQTEGFKNSINQILDSYQAGIEKSREFKNAVKVDFKETQDTAKDAAKSIDASLRSGVVNAISVSAQQIGKSLAGAGGGVKAFVGVVINALGDMAISLGTTVIASSKAIEALKAAFLGPVGSGVAAIGLGAALIAAGAALKVFGSSFGASSPSPSVSGFGEAAGAGIGGGQFSETLPEERAEAETKVNVTIQGDVFDSEETGLRIARILEDSSLNENVRVVGGLA